MFRLRSCPRCYGDLREGKDRYGEYVICLHCGYHRSEPEDRKPQFPPRASKRGRPRKSVSGAPSS